MRRTIRSLMELGTAATAAVMLVACSYNPPAGMDTPAGLYLTLNTAPYAAPKESDRWTAIDTPRLRADHGYECVSASRAATRDYIGIRVHSSAAIPANYDATVFLNGWKATYKKKDHHVTGLGAVIFNIERQGSNLVWDAGGLIADKNGDDAFEWCYHYTLLFFPKAATDTYDIKPEHVDSSGRLIFVDGGSGNVVHTIAGSYTSPGTGRPPRAALPVGFGQLWTSSDHHVLETGFDLGNQSLAGTTLRWTSNAILKDNAANRKYYAFEAVSILRGSGFGVIHPATVLHETDSGWVSQSNALKIAAHSPTSCARAELGDPYHYERYAVTGLGSESAIPMLTGWQLRYNCEDQHVQGVGAWIEDFEYVPPTGPLRSDGTLYYTVATTLRDKSGGVPNFIDRHEVSVLGIARRQLAINPGGVIDANPVPSR